ncbi:MAG: ABC transporter permease [Chloroflexi bacterium]|nr:ABC transporter permease [Chloroflexota bacterium]
MTRLILHRLAWSLPLLFVVTVMSFVLVSFVPGDPARTILGQSATQQQVDSLRQQLGLNQPLWTRYLNWLGGLFHGNLGSSLFTGESVSQLLNQRLGVTLTLMIAGTLVATIIGVILGVTSAVRGGLLARLIDTLSLAGLALPNFFLALVLVALFAVKLSWFPATGYVNFTASPIDWFRSLVLPTVALAFTPITIVAAVAREAMAGALTGEYVRVLQANGFSRRSVIYRHALKNAGVPVVTIVAIMFVGLLTGTVFAEQIFALPGLGSATVTAATQGDIPVVQGAVLYFTVIIVLVNILTDVAYGFLNPKVRVS